MKRDPEQASAYRMMRHYEDSRKRSDQIRNQLRGSLALAFPELNELFQDLTSKTALSLLEKSSTPGKIKALGTRHFLHRWRGRRGPMGRKYFESVYELAKASIGVEDPTGRLAQEIKAQASEFRHALEVQERWFQRAEELLKPRQDYRLVGTIPGIGLHRSEERYAVQDAVIAPQIQPIRFCQRDRCRWHTVSSTVSVDLAPCRGE